MGSLHGQRERKDWDGLYAGATDEYREGVTKEKNEAYFSAIDRKLGSPTESNLNGVQVNATASGQYLRANFKTTFAKDASGQSLWCGSGWMDNTGCSFTTCSRRS